MSGIDTTGAALAQLIVDDAGIKEIFPARGLAAASALLSGEPAPLVQVVEDDAGTEITVTLCTRSSVPTPQTLRRIADRIAEHLATEKGGDHAVRVRLHVSSID
ncbi:hypothetical protein [Leucobacter sp.]